MWYIASLATRSDENEQNRSQVNMKLFRSSLDLPHEDEDTPVVRSDGKNTMLLFCYGLKMSRGFRCLKPKSTANLLLYKRNILF